MIVDQVPDRASPDMDTPSLTSSSSASSASTAPSPAAIDLVFHHQGINLTLAVPSIHFPLLNSQKDAFVLSQSTSGLDDPPQTAVELALAFVEFLLLRQKSCRAALAAIVHAFDGEFLEDHTDIHSLVAELTTSFEQRQRWLRSYYRAIETGPCDGKLYSRPHTSNHGRSAFFHQAQCNQFHLMAVFGGQGDASRTCVQELSDLYRT